MPPRASWKGFLKIADVTVPAGLYAAASTAERIAPHAINRPAAARVRREFVDAETGETVERGDQAGGYEVAKDEYVPVEPRRGGETKLKRKTGRRVPAKAKPAPPRRRAS